MTTPPPARKASRSLAALDGLMNRIYGSRFNPIYQSGTLVVVLWILLLITGLWLLLFYRVGAAWDSVAAITADPWVGRWMRGLHRYGSDAAVVAVVVHALRIFLQRRTWGPRALAWITGVGLFGLLMVCGWTGYVMVWDGFGERLAIEGARLLDALPILSEPVRRSFAGDRPLPGAFFFLNLFLHVALPLGLAVGLWLHVSRLGRPTLLPPRRLTWALVGLLLLLSLGFPVAIAPQADPLTVPATLRVDWFYGFWLPIARRAPAAVSWTALLAVVVPLFAVPWLTRPRAAVPKPSRVDSRTCTGCGQCAVDCPYEAMTMVARADRPGQEVVRIDPARCVSCGICAASCDVLAVGPPGRTGGAQLEAIAALCARGEIAGHPVAFACEHGPATELPTLEAGGVTVIPVECLGNLHPFAIERALAGGATAVAILGCPPRDCWNREGSRWLEERIDHGRRPALPAAADRSRIQRLEVQAYDTSAVLALLGRLRARERR